MLSRLILKPSHLRFITLLSSKPQIQPNPISKTPSLNPHHFSLKPHFYSTNNGNNKPPDLWDFSSPPDPTDPLFPQSNQTPDHLTPENNQESGHIGKIEAWVDEDDEGDDIFKRVESKGGGGDWEGESAEADWDFEGEDEGKAEDDLFKNVGLGEEGVDGFQLDLAQEKRVDLEQLQVEEKGLMEVLKGPDRAFGDLIAASGITDEMLDSLIALKDLEGIQGLPPLAEIEDLRYKNNTKKSSRAELERQKQEEVTRARVRVVDSQGRAYGTGKRKCSIARVWIHPGDGKFVVNDHEFDVYFPMLDHRAALLRPFTETKTLGTFDVSCSVKGGGVSGQVGAVRLGISRALQCWDPSLRPPLKAVGFLTRDSRIVERKKPGRAKARKSFQWVKR